jgi:type I restriction enzyme M protein
VLTPGRYVGAEDVEDDGEAFEVKLARLSANLEEQFMVSSQLAAEIRVRLRAMKHVDR